MIPYAIKLGGVLLASYACFALALDAAFAAAWFAFLRRRRWSSSDLLALRLAPIVGAALLCAAVVLPAFLCYEPAHRREPLGTGLLGLGALAVVLIGAGIVRALRAGAATRRLVRSCTAGRCVPATAQGIEIVDVAEPLVAVFGALRPRVLAARRVLQSCSAEEFQCIVDHETAHIAAADNLKLALLHGCPDLIGSLPFGTVLVNRWKAAAEFDADERAAGADRARRLALASALIKVARLTGRRASFDATTVMAVAAGQVEERVRRLLSTAPSSRRGSLRYWLIGCALATPIAALPAYATLHRCIELLVALR
jgi:hypothetical protein